MRPTGNVLPYDGSGRLVRRSSRRASATLEVTSPPTPRCSWNRNWIAATIPRNTFNGEYLVRFEHIGKLPPVYQRHLEPFLTESAGVHRSTSTGLSITSPACRSASPAAATDTPGPLVRFPAPTAALMPTMPTSAIYGGHRSSPSGPAVWNGSRRWRHHPHQPYQPSHQPLLRCYVRPVRWNWLHRPYLLLLRYSSHSHQR